MTDDGVGGIGRLAGILAGKIRHCPSCEDTVRTYTKTVKSPAIGVRIADYYVEKVTYCTNCGADLNRTNDGYE